MANIYGLIIAGGAGTRFWPASRRSLPKQLLPLASAGSETLLGATIRRISPIIPADRLYIATGDHLADMTAISAAHVPREQILAEPVPRNTAPCIAWGVSVIARRDPDALIAVFPADHHVRDEAAFCQTVTRALDAAKLDRLVTIGIVPTRVETGYGYIERGAAIGDDVYEVKRFIEKPIAEAAARYVNGGHHFWNAGCFFFRAKTFLEALREQLPAVARAMNELDRAAERGDEQAALRELFPQLPSISIDHGIMEKAENVAVVPGEFGWSDVGGWASAWELADRDSEGNALPAGAIAIDAERNYVADMTTHSQKRLYAIVGMSDLVVIETDDAVLIIPRERAQDVRTVVQELNARGKGLV